jgi:predicted permease
VQAIFNVALPIFGVILAGFLAGRWRILGPEATTALNAFVSYFALPVLFFGTLARTPESPWLPLSSSAWSPPASFREAVWRR